MDLAGDVLGYFAVGRDEGLLSFGVSGHPGLASSSLVTKDRVGFSAPESHDLPPLSLIC